MLGAVRISTTRLSGSNTLQVESTYSCSLVLSLTIQQRMRRIRQMSLKGPTTVYPIIMSSPWWSRSWTLQENVLPKNSTFIYSSWKLDCKALLSANAKYEEHIKSCCAYEYHRSIDRIATMEQGLLQIMYTLTNLIGRCKRPPLDDLTRMALCRVSSEPRDAVYSLLGLMNPMLSRQLTVSYTVATADIFIEAFLLLHKEMDYCWSVFVNSVFAQGTTRIPGLPSWVPDFSGTISDPQLVWDIERCRNLYHIYNACGRTKTHIHLASNYQLERQGYQAGTVSEAAKTSYVSKPTEIKDLFKLTVAEARAIIGDQDP
jgi:hypothetical protein